MFDEGDDNGLTPHIRTKDGYTLSYDGQRIYHLSGSVYPSSFPIGRESTLFHSNVIGDDFFTWWDKRLDDYLGFWSQSWVNTYSWTDPDINYSVWLQEVVDFIDNLKDSVPEWGADNNEINVYIFKYKYADYPTSGQWAYYPIFYKGNSTSCDAIMTPTT